MKKHHWWGELASVDLFDCDPKLIRSKRAIRRYVKELCQLIKMKRNGKTLIKRFGKGKLRGYSMMQFIETSSIIAHFDETENRAFIDIFSCRKFNDKKVAKFSKEFFKAKKTKERTLQRK